MLEYVIVIGGGISGLTAAYELSKSGEKVILVEKSKNLGGLAQGIKVGSSFIERSYHIIFPAHSNTIGLFRELGLGDKIIWKTAKTGFYADKLYKVSSPWEVLAYKPLSLANRLRIFTTTFKMLLIRDALAFDSITCKEWVEKSANGVLYEKFFRPMMRGKFQDNADSISATWFIERMKLRNKRNLDGEIVGYPSCSFHAMIEKLGKEIIRRGSIILTNSTIKKLEVKNSKITSAHIGNKKFGVKAVVSTIPPQQLAQIIELPQNYLDRFFLPYEGTICVMLRLKKPLTNNLYWINLMREDIKFGAIVEHTSLMPWENYNSHIAYLASYYPQEHPVWKKSDADIFESYFKDLNRLFPNIRSSDIIAYDVFREKFATIICRKGIASKIKNLSCRTPVKNLFVGGVFSSYPENNINLAISKGRECAGLVKCIA